MHLVFQGKTEVFKKRNPTCVLRTIMLHVTCPCNVGKTSMQEKESNMRLEDHHATCNMSV